MPFFLSLNTSHKFINNELIQLHLLFADCHYLQIRTDEAFLTRFLICLEWNVFEAFTRMKKFFKLKVNNLTSIFPIRFSLFFSFFCYFSTNIQNGSWTENYANMTIFWSKIPNKCLTWETSMAEGFICPK